MAYCLNITLAVTLCFVSQTEGVVSKNQFVGRFRNVLAKGLAKPGHDFDPRVDANFPGINYRRRETSGTSPAFGQQPKTLGRPSSQSLRGVCQCYSIIGFDSYGS
jgi:hypothetical protein